MGVPVSSGVVLAGKYQVERVLGEGGMGVVVAARHLHLGHMVALKFLLAEAAANDEARARFLREARNAVRLQSEHVARVSDVGTLDDGAPYIVMEFLQGRDLAAVLAQHGPMPVAVAVDYVLQACDAIAEAHSLGIVHRDLKPQNLFMARRHDNTTLVKVLDFGISKSLAGDDLRATKTGAVFGTVAYMSPEQMRSSRAVDPRSDVWSLGVILYELVTGRLPWEGETFAALCLKAAMDPLPRLPPQLGAFEAVLQRCLEKDPARRFCDVAALASALLPFAPEQAPLVESISRTLRVPAGGQSPLPNPQAVVELGTLREAVGQQVTQQMPRGRRRWGVPVGALALAGTIAVVVLGSRGSEAPAEESAASQPAPSAALPAQSAPVASPAEKAAAVAPPAPIVEASPVAPRAAPAKALPAEAKASPVAPQPAKVAPPKPIAPPAPAAKAPAGAPPPAAKPAASPMQQPTDEKKVESKQPPIEKKSAPASASTSEEAPLRATPRVVAPRPASKARPKAVDPLASPD